MTIGFQPVARRRRRELAEFIAAGGQFVPSDPPPQVAEGSPYYYGTAVRPYVPVRPKGGVSIGQIQGYRSARFGGVTPASAKSASAVRRYEAQLHGYAAGGDYKQGYMNVKNAREIRDYAEDLLGRIDQARPLPPWAEHKLSVARTHIGDVKHYVQHMQAHGDERTACMQTIAARDAQAQATAMQPTASVPGELSPNAQTGYPATRSDTMSQGMSIGSVYQARERRRRQTLLDVQRARVSQAQGASIGAPITPAQAATMQGVLQEHGYGVGSVFQARQRRRRETLLEAQRARMASSGFSVGNDGHDHSQYGDGLVYQGVYYSPEYLEQAGGSRIARLRRMAIQQQALRNRR